MPNVNALDITWTLPADYAIPDDGTTAKMTCNAATADDDMVTVY